MSRSGSASSMRPPALNPRYSDGNRQDSVDTRSSSPGLMPPDATGTFFNDYSEHEVSPASPSFRPGTGFTFASEPTHIDCNRDHRRPSVASATTISSQGSRSSTSGKFRKRLQGFFGDEYQGSGDSKQDLDSGRQSQNSRRKSGDKFKFRERANSDVSPNMSERRSDLSRPDTPLPSSEITPWVYQSFNVSVKISWFPFLAANEFFYH